MLKSIIRLLLLAIIIPNLLFAQDKKEESLDVSGLKFRCVGPSLTSGRISDIAVYPRNPYQYYVTAASGGVWKTDNNGTTFKPIFDSQGSYSIGCVAIDPSNPDIVWVGTGENNNQRSVAYGDGVYKSKDGGKTWENVGLKMSEHIGQIAIHPNDGNVVVVAAMGPLWKEGGDRGIYKTTDGGKTWKHVLNIDMHTGANEVHYHPKDPNIMYAATQQRRRHVFTYVGGGKESSVYKSIDGGDTWSKVENGLPTGKMGRIGLAISPANPDYIYAIVEASDDKDGVYLSTNGGVSWNKQGSYSTSGNYYQEIVADPKDPNKLYSMNTWLQVSTDQGKTFKYVGEKTKHVDNHCMWIDPANTDHWIVGCDGGVYETFDHAATWLFKANLPLTQFYKVSVDTDSPFYNIYGGTQDNNSMFGPARVANDHGIVNSDWTITHGGDGFESVADPQNPNIVYAQSQYGVLVRYDKLTGEEVGIQPKERKGENSYRWNWDAPLIASPHKSGRVYFAANKVFKSDDYGNSWEVISEDLTRQINRNTLKVMDRVQHMDAVEKNGSTSPYGTIVAMSESPKDPNLIVVGTDDGLIHITNDGGTTWRRIEQITGAPRQSYINAVYCSQHDAKVMYAAINHHKYGDFKPYLFMSTDGGSSWKSISANLPERGSVYAIEEDHVNANLLFCGTEFGVHYSNDKGKSWHALKSGLPTIAVRDIAIQRREDDLVLGTFGRGFYVMDDYSPLRSLPTSSEVDSNRLFSIRDSWQFELNSPYGGSGQASQGDGFYTADNLGSEVLIRFYTGAKYESAKDARKKKEGEAIKANLDTAYPTYEDLVNERDEKAPELLFVIKNSDGEIVRKLHQKPGKGLQTITWDMRYAAKDPVDLRKSSWQSPWSYRSYGPFVAPGTYTVDMYHQHGKSSTLVGTQSFKIKPVDDRSLPRANDAEKESFQADLAEFNRSVSGAQKLIGEINDKLAHMEVAIQAVPIITNDVAQEIEDLKDSMRDLQYALNGDPLKSKLDIGEPPAPSGRLGWIMYEQRHSSSPVTKTHQMSFNIAKEEFEPVFNKLKQMAEQTIPALEAKLEAADAPYTPGRAIQLMRGY